MRTQAYPGSHEITMCRELLLAVEDWFYSHSLGRGKLHARFVQRQ